MSASVRKPHNDHAGYVCERRTGAPLPDGRRDFVTVYRAAEQGLEDDPSHPWAVVCQAHSTLVTTTSQRAARSIMASGGVEFCDCCRRTCHEGMYGQPCPNCGRQQEEGA